MFTLAYLSDPHLAPLPKPSLRELLNKRVLGYLNWAVNRKDIHDRQILDSITQDMLAQGADHIAVGGDLINLSLREEYSLALDWLKTLGPPKDVSVVPGNHDRYVRVNKAVGINLWSAYMTTDIAGSKEFAPAPNGFPYVRQFGNVALVGLSSAVPKPPFFASGRLGAEQIAVLSRTLNQLGRRDLFRIVMIHHPPLPGLSSFRRGLDDVAGLEMVLRQDSAELVLYGHRHMHSIDMLAGTPQTPVIGASSASSSHTATELAPRYDLFRIWRSGKKWKCEMTGRGLEAAGEPVTELERRMIIE